MSKRIAAIGDIHGAIVEFKDLVSRLDWMSLDEIWLMGDLCDRGPASGEVYQYAIERKFPSVLGNHDNSILGHFDRVSKGGKQPDNPDKRKTIRQMTQQHAKYISTMPDFHIIDDLKLILVHGGMYPQLPFQIQPKTVIRAQMVNPSVVGSNRWWGDCSAEQPYNKKTEEQSRAEGWERWYRIWDHEYRVCFGHAVFTQPFIYQRENFGACIGIDNGSCFGGLLTAAVFDSPDNDPVFLSVKARQVYSETSTKVYVEK